jgi:hypothetical protein
MMAINKVISRIEQMEALLESAHLIARRQGADTAWDRFAESLEKAGIGYVTARTYKILPSDLEPENG